MAVRVAYGKKKSVNSAIANGTIPKDSIIITKDDTDSELLFYDGDGNLKTIAERTRFESMSEAEQWVNSYPCVGFILTIYNGSNWSPYIVNSDNTLSPIMGKVPDIENVICIDGGTSEN